MKLWARAVLIEDGFALVNCAPGGLRLFGGRVEDGESPEGALVREIDEELGIFVDIGQLVAVWKRPRGLEMAFQVHPPQAVGRELKHARMTWVPARMLPSMLLPTRHSKMVYNALATREGLDLVLSRPPLLALARAV